MLSFYLSFQWMTWPPHTIFLPDCFEDFDYDIPWFDKNKNFNPYWKWKNLKFYLHSQELNFKNFTKSFYLALVSNLRQNQNCWITIRKPALTLSKHTEWMNILKTEQTLTWDYYCFCWRVWSAVEFQALLEQRFITFYLEKVIDVPMTFCIFTPYS